MSKKLLFAFVLMVSLLSCSNNNGQSREHKAQVQDHFTSYDLIFFEAHGHVKRIQHSDYIDGKDIKKRGNDYVAVKPLSKYHPLEEDFDKKGKWTSISEEDLRRDSKGRIVFRWDPEGDKEYEWNDSLVTCYIDDHNSRYQYDYSKEGWIIKETYLFKDPNTENAKFVVYGRTLYHYVRSDSRGNWIERWRETYYDKKEEPQIYVDLRSYEYYD